jgi:hypothetical protein
VRCEGKPVINGKDRDTYILELLQTKYPELLNNILIAGNKREFNYAVWLDAATKASTQIVLYFGSDFTGISYKASKYIKAKFDYQVQLTKQTSLRTNPIGLPRYLENTIAPKPLRSNPVTQGRSWTSVVQHTSRCVTDITIVADIEIATESNVETLDGVKTESVETKSESVKTNTKSVSETNTESVSETNTESVSETKIGSVSEAEAKTEIAHEVEILSKNKSLSIASTSTGNSVASTAILVDTSESSTNNPETNTMKDKFIKTDAVKTISEAHKSPSVRTWAQLVYDLKTSHRNLAKRY